MGAYVSTAGNDCCQPPCVGRDLPADVSARPVRGYVFQCLYASSHMDGHGSGACRPYEPARGPAKHRRGHRSTMLIGILFALAGVIAVAFANGLAVTIAGLGIVGIGGALYLPAMQAYVSELTPFAHRGRALGAVELSWSLAGIIAVPPLVTLVEWSGDFRLPFMALAALLAGVFLLCIAALPREHHDPGRRAALAPAGRALFRQPALWALLLFLWLVMAGAEILFIAQAPWLSERFANSSQAIAVALFVFGLGELLGALMATAWTDRVGKKRAPIIGFVAAAGVYLALPATSESWNAYLILFALYAVAFEFAIVSSFSLASGLAPAARGTVMAASAVATSTGRGAGSWVGIRLFESTNIAVNGAVAAVATLIGVGVAFIGVQPQENDRDSDENKAVRIL